MTHIVGRDARNRRLPATKERKDRQSRWIVVASAKCGNLFHVLIILSKYGQKLPGEGSEAQGERRTRYRADIGWFYKVNKRCHSELSCSFKSCAFRSERGCARRFFDLLPKLLDRHTSHPHFPLKELAPPPTQFPQSSHAAKDQILKPRDGLRSYTPDATRKSLPYPGTGHP